MANKLGSGDQFPPMALKLLDGNSLTLPDDLEADYNVVLIYRGHW